MKETNEAIALAITFVAQRHWRELRPVVNGIYTQYAEDRTARDAALADVVRRLAKGSTVLSLELKKMEEKQ